MDFYEAVADLPLLPRRFVRILTFSASSSTLLSSPSSFAYSAFSLHRPPSLPSQRTSTAHVSTFLLPLNIPSSTKPFPPLDVAASLPFFSLGSCTSSGNAASPDVNCVSHRAASVLLSREVT